MTTFLVFATAIKSRQAKFRRRKPIRLFWLGASQYRSRFRCSWNRLTASRQPTLVWLTGDEWVNICFCGCVIPSSFKKSLPDVLYGFVRFDEPIVGRLLWKAISGSSIIGFKLLNGYRLFEDVNRLCIDRFKHDLEFTFKSRRAVRVIDFLTFSLSWLTSLSLWHVKDLLNPKYNTFVSHHYTVIYQSIIIKIK